jgi:monoamine oxidase
MIYDIIIIGGGIAGLYTANQILKKSHKINILILEKESRLGGRVYTYKDKYMSVEAGAGRFSQQHKLLFELLDELQLNSKIIEITSNSKYFPSGCNDHNIDHDLKTILIKIIAISYLDIFTDFRQISFLDYAKKVVSSDDVKYIKDSFGYYSELVIMNAHDAIQLMKQLDPNNKFYVLQGGLSQIINMLEKKILKYKNAKILTKKNVISIIKGNGNGNLPFQVVLDNNNVYYGKKCICALPKQVIEKFLIFKPVRNLLKNILCSPLCRIYSKFVDNIWFKNLPKITTNNNLRIIIPISEKDGTIMMSYTDNKYAEFWKKLNDDKGIKGVNKELLRLMKLTTCIDVPYPQKTHIFYWKYGVGYWKIGADSNYTSQKLIKPYDDMDLFICGEHYSEKNQQWMEGALETSMKVLEKLDL